MEATIPGLLSAQSEHLLLSGIWGRSGSEGLETGGGGGGGGVAIKSGKKIEMESVLLKELSKMEPEGH